MLSNNASSAFSLGTGGGIYYSTVSIVPGYCSDEGDFGVFGISTLGDSFSVLA